jgi:isopenicillin N synthase-like dioxygenase
MSTLRIPTLNVQDFLSGDPTLKSKFVSDLGKAYTDTGFVVIRNHAVSTDLQSRAYKAIDAFFKLPESTKTKYSVPGIGGARGYTAFGLEHAKDSPVGDLKEFFHVGMNPSAKYDYPANVTVTEVPELKPTLWELYTSLLDLGCDVLRAIAILLNQPENYFQQYAPEGDSILRPIHYPPLKGDEQPKAVRSAAHEDINLITLLIGASNPGLQVLTQQGEWLPITTAPSEIVVNVGDMLQRLSNYKFRSTTHRVVNPPATQSSQARFSIPFFLHPINDMSLAALKTCVTPANPPKDPPTTAGEYLQERLREIGLT